MFGQPDTDWFVEARFGMFIHWGLYSLGARHEWIQNYECIPSDVYEKRYFDKFEPDLFDPHEWATLAKQAGMKYFVITTKHHEGFCMWDTKYTDYNAMKSPAKCDLLGNIVDAFRQEGFRVGLYHSLIDWHHPEFPPDALYPLGCSDEICDQEKHRDIKKYAEYLHNQIRELLTNYGKIDLAWFDYSYPTGPRYCKGKGRDDWQSEKLLKMVRELQPGIMVNNRLDLPGKPDFLTPEQYMPYNRPTCDGEEIVWEGCHTFSGSWGYNRDETSWKSDKQCIWMLIESVSKGGNLLMNVGPTARGEFDSRAKDKLEVYGKWMRYHSRSIYGCTEAPKEFVAPRDTRLTYNPKINRMYIHLLNYPFGGLYLPACFKDRIEYAQLLNDASELKFEKAMENVTSAYFGRTEVKEAPLVLKLPNIEPDVQVPVIELFMR